ncbi:B12-binding domain-containing radical SAM protein [uncultured Tyzzerella sp.]|uniref:B12-binding domain-containing radical SAM protein n=1 Tax=uncultured Tyzzerella sp. TaxID=2321398 RepID=UPI002942477D|nr:B12-binding domain-containing radical SAM protein [uncultured Tyzzerella sp.]
MITIKTLLVGINAKYIHTSLAVRSIEIYCKENNTNINTREFTINNDEDMIINEIYEEKPDFLGFSCYIWNINTVLDVISTIKKILPNIKIFVGGPEVSYEYDYIFKKGVDIVCIGEGEKTVKELVDNFNEKKCIDKSFENIDGIAFMLNNRIVVTKERDLLPLNNIPFVYKNGLEGTENKILYYEASRGCPYSCQYCLSSLERGLRFLNEERVKQDLDFFLKHNVKQVKFVDRTFNCNKKFALLIWNYLIENDNGITNFHFEISADIVDDDMLNVLKMARLGLFQFEIGVQSTNDATLDEIKRKTNLQKLFDKVGKIKNLKNIHQHLDLIAGLPFEDYEIFKKSFNDVFSVYPEQFQLGFLKLLKGSGLRINADKYGIVYKDKAPYEVLYTNLIDYDKMTMLRNIEEMVETYYNSGKAINTIKYGIKFFSSPFNFFEQLAIYWKTNNYNNISHNKMKLYEVLYIFVNNIKGIDDKVLNEIVKFDILLNDNIKSLPLWLDTKYDNDFKEKERKFYNNEENIKKYIPHLEKYDAKQISRMCYFEKFNIDIETMINSNFDIINQKEVYILFDYNTKNDLIYKVKYHYLERGNFNEA